ncbi:MAG: hypothetical protein FJ296_11470, partial [Planctomycetes bacterium]|nr:hypothetical protein [Planctomycetota bacterium]
LRFEDVPRALQRAGVPGGDEGALALRLDGGLRHVLLDEFQDTSTPQWQVLAPLLRRALADARRHVFVVGDTKQSIYGWRAGEPRLLGALAGMGLLSEDIALSRRSAPAVMEAVNALFADLPSNPGLGDEPAVADAARDWHGAAAFPHHETARQQLAGAVRLWELPTPDESGAEERRTLLAQAAADLVARLVQADPRASVGVLVRVNKPIPRLLHALRARGVPASGEGGNALTDSEAVLVLLSLLLLADHPGDTAAAFHVATSPLGPRLGLRFGDAAGQQALAERVRSALLAGGYGAWLDQRLADVRACPEFSAWDRRRAAQLVDLGHAWDARATLRPGDFVAHVRGTPIEDPATARVRVLTVHAAKGLEFDAVVCPDLERDPLRRRGEPGLVWDRADPQGAISGIFLRVSRDKAAQAGHGSLVRLLDAALQREVREELCVLYVALTRARRRLDLLVSAARPAAVSFAALLRHALQQDGAPGGEPGAARRLHQARDAGDDPLLDGALCPRLP